MSTIDSTDLTADELAGMLEAWAAGDYPREAAVGLLIAHRGWLGRADFRRQLIHAVDDGWAAGGALVPMAMIDWDRIGTFVDTAPASGSERRILLAAASLAGHHHTTSMLGLLSALDHANTRLLLDAVAHACGWHEHGVTATVTGHVGAGAP